MLDLQAGAAEGDGQVEAGHDAGVDLGSAVKRSIGSTTGCTITEKAPTRAFSWLKAPTSGTGGTGGLVSIVSHSRRPS